MRRRMLVALGVVLFASVARAEDAARKDLEALQGEWVMAALEIDGKQVPEEKIRGTTLTVKGDRYTVKVKDNSHEVTFKLDPSQKPKAIDMFLPNGTDAPKRSPGIYKIDGDTFQLCRAQAAEQERPRDFGTWPNTGVFLVTWKRKAP
jgi:uncharacterized protein (TIGR03067 family)